ncbi:MAG TPA: S8 family serine peptidase [Actinophytocola sp.]|nr:S8 family serine peptidase [Actinophytocola sp.]
MTPRRLAGLFAGAALAATLLTSPPAGAEPPPAPPDAADSHTTVTLVTGDEVRVTDGRVAGVRMAPGREHQRVWRYEANGHEYVVPADAAPLVDSGRVDERLFDVTELLRQGLDDRATDVVPLIVESGTLRGRTFASGLTAVDTPKDGSAWRRLTTARASGKVWLNGRVQPTLEQSVPQVGAPEAWAAGFRGDGTTVAVLDTGYDATHPDLRGVVAQARDFTGEGPATVDTVGHGTHVASTIAGRDDRRTGVAPGATLLVGKVLGESGGTEANVIAGMEWAVAQGADVVNMSLGSGPTDGTDLVSQRLNALSASSGTLFVVSAGNYGARGTIGSPGSADRALTVGSVTKDDELSVFSSQGPRTGDHGLKPEIAAPGSDIVAARAEGTNPASSVDERYARMSGTSMAAPHVAGAAAILAGQHPEWTAEQLKSALVGSARRLAGVDTYAQGAGRLDVARAVAQPVRAEGVLGFGEAWAGEAAELTRTVTYANDGDTPVTLDLALDVDSDLFALDRERVTVPARSSTEVAVTVRVPSRPAGEVSGVLTATGAGVTLNTPLTASLPGEAHTLSVRVLPRDGGLVTSLLLLQNEDTGRTQVHRPTGGVARFTVPTGRYRVVGRTLDYQPVSDTLYVHPTGLVDRDTEVVIDTGEGEEVTASLDDPAARPQSAGGHAVSSEVNGVLASMTRTSYVSRREKLYTIGSPRLDGVALHHFSYWTPPMAEVTVEGPGGFEFEDTYVASYPRFEGTLTAEVVHVGKADRAAIDAAGDVRGKIALIAPPDWGNPAYPPGQQLRDGIALLAERGAKLVLSFYNPQVGQDEYGRLALPVVLLYGQADLRDLDALLAAGPVEATVLGRRTSPTAYFLADAVHGRIPAGHAFRFHREGLGRIDRTLVDTLPDGTYRFMPTTFGLDGFQAGADVEVEWPAHRVDHVTPGTSLSTYAAGGFDEQGDFAAEVTVPVTLRRGEHRNSRVFAAPFGPELTTPYTSNQDGEPIPWAYREGDRLVLSVPMFADSDPGNVSGFDRTQRGSTVVREGGRVIDRRDDEAGLGTFDLPAGPGRFQVIASAGRPASLLLEPALSTRTRAVWSFRARGGTDDRVALPFLDVRFALPLDDHNRASAGEPVRGRVTVAHQPGSRASRIRDVIVEVSYDDGRTWRRATVDGQRVEIPAGGEAGGYASLRATATDRHGNAVTETVIRAYALE